MLAKSGRADNLKMLFWTGIFEILAKTLAVVSLENRTPQNLIIANFEHPVSKTLITTTIVLRQLHNAVVVNHTHNGQKQSPADRPMQRAIAIIQCVVATVIDIISESGPQCLNYDRFFLQTLLTIKSHR